MQKKYEKRVEEIFFSRYKKEGIKEELNLLVIALLIIMI